MPVTQPGVFIRFDPVQSRSPVLVDVSRSGREYPPDFRSPLPFTALHDNVSMYVEDLFGDAPNYGATLLFASFPNTYIDTNRSVLDIDPDLVAGEWPEPLEPEISKRGLGLIKSVSRYGTPLQEDKLAVDDIMHRIDAYHAPYHAELGRTIKDIHSEFGYVIQLSCHCMSAVGQSTHPDPGEDRADFCIGDTHGTTSRAEPVEFIVETLRGNGYSVSVNTPYPGGELTTRHSDPTNGIDSIFIEVNKRLFMDIETFKPIAKFDTIKKTTTSLVNEVVAYTQEQLK